MGLYCLFVYNKMTQGLYGLTLAITFHLPEDQIVFKKKNVGVRDGISRAYSLPVPSQSPNLH